MLNLPSDVQARLLGRQVTDLLTTADRAMRAGRRALITGAGGSIGGELARQLAACGLERLTLIDSSEYALFRIESELRRRFPDAAIDAFVADITRRVDLKAAFDAARPHVVYHAAAYKHVPIAERAIVPAVRTNVLGTVEVLRAAEESGARFVLISSDKAAEPRSVMGATKRLAELAALDAAHQAFRPVVVRFGNVLGSSGSVVEVMADCVADGRNVPITDPDATRFFMTVSEAVSLVLKADLMAGDPGVFWLDMGEPIRIGTLAERFIAWATPKGQQRVGIDVIGLRPGEKVHEELTTHGLEMRQTKHPRVLRATQAPAPKFVVTRALRAVRIACDQGDAGMALDALIHAVSDFIPSEAAFTAAGRKDHSRWVEHVRSSAVAAAS